MWPMLEHATTPWSALAAGMVWAFFMGSVLGNLATNPIFRLPRGMNVTKEKPFCDHCHTPLTPRDLFPIFSWLLALGKCRTCKVAVPSAYFWVELSFAVLHVVAYVRLGFSEGYLLATTAIGAFIAASAMLILSQFRSWRTLMIALIPSLLWVALRDQSLNGILQGLLFVGPLLLVGMYFQQEKARPVLAGHFLRTALVVWFLSMWATSFSSFIMAGIVCLAVGYGLVFTVGRAWRNRHECALLLGLAAAVFYLAFYGPDLTASSLSGIVLAVPADSFLL